MDTVETTDKKRVKVAKRNGKKAIFAILFVIWAIILTVAACVTFLVIKPACDNINALSSEIGEQAGFGVALAAAPIYLPVDVVEGLYEGRLEGLSAEDTTVTTERPIESLGAGTLEVLKADFSIEDVQKQGNENNPSYAVLYVVKGEVIFSVDLNQVDIKYKGKDVTITIPKPSCRLVFDESGMEKIAEFSTIIDDIFSSPEDGIVSDLNTRKQLIEKAPEELKDYAQLIDLAEAEAKTQIQSLAEAVIFDKTITVIVQGE